MNDRIRNQMPCAPKASLLWRAPVASVRGPLHVFGASDVTPVERRAP